MSDATTPTMTPKTGLVAMLEGDVENCLGIPEVQVLVTKIEAIIQAEIAKLMPLIEQALETKLQAQLNTLVSKITPQAK